MPVWRPRYLAAPDGLAMAGALLTMLISGGVGKYCGRRRQRAAKVERAQVGAR